MRGAGGSDGGLMSFLIGLVMMCSGFYMLLNAIVIRSRFGFGYNLYNVGGFSITSGMIMIPFIFGVGLIFYNSKNYLGWILAGVSLISLIFGVIASVNFSFQRMSAFDLIVILVLAFGGLGLFLRSLYPAESRR
ncbi:MAG: hypothetical protein ACPG47_11310 [Leucothrix sp.]